MMRDALGSTVSIRPVVAADVPGVVALVRAVLAEFELAFGDGCETDAALLALPESYTSQRGAFWVAETGEGAVLGTCGISPVSTTVYELRKMYLSPESRRAGIGKRMLELALSHARDQGAERVVLDTVESMKAAIAFYERHGFVRDDEQIRGCRCSRGYSLSL